MNKGTDGQDLGFPIARQKYSPGIGLWAVCAHSSYEHAIKLENIDEFGSLDWLFFHQMPIRIDGELHPPQDDAPQAVNLSWFRNLAEMERDPPSTGMM